MPSNYTYKNIPKLTSSTTALTDSSAVIYVASDGSTQSLTFAGLQSLITQQIVTNGIRINGNLVVNGSIINTLVPFSVTSIYNPIIINTDCGNIEIAKDAFGSITSEYLVVTDCNFNGPVEIADMGALV